MLFGILLLGLAVIGGLRLANREPLTRELRSLEKDSALLKNIINDLEYSMDMDSSNTYEKFLTGFYSSHKTGYPNVAPVQGYVTRGLQHENNHLGIDIAAKNLDEVRVPADGKVVFCGKSEDLGNTIIIKRIVPKVKNLSKDPIKIIISKLYLIISSKKIRVVKFKNRKISTIYKIIIVRNKNLEDTLINPLVIDEK